MKKHSPISTPFSTSTPLEKPVTHIWQIGKNEFEFIGTNISEHYTIRPSLTDECRLDVVYLGAGVTSHSLP